MAQIVDAFGRPINTVRLREELAEGNTLAPVRNLNFPTEVFSLTPERLARILMDVHSGHNTSFLTLAEEMEERDNHFFSVLGTRKNAVSQLEVKVEAASDDPNDVKICDAVTELTKVAAFRSMLPEAMDALSKGYSVIEIMWDRSVTQWTPREYKWRDPRFFVFDRATLSELRLLTPDAIVEGEVLEPYKFIQHRPKLKTGIPIRGGLARVACVAFMFKSYDIKAWMTFAEVYGMPLRIGKYGTGATAEQKDALRRAVANIGIDAAAIVPDSMTLEIIQAQAAQGGAQLFEGMAVYFDKQMSKAVLGQTMTADDGSSMSQAVVHDTVRGDIRDSDAEQLAATLNRDLVRAYVDLNFGPQKRYPLLSLFEPDEEDLKLFSDAVGPLIDRGLEVEESHVRDKFNIPEPAKGARLLKPMALAAAAPMSLLPPSSPLPNLPAPVTVPALPGASKPAAPIAPSAPIGGDGVAAIDPSAALNGAQVSSLKDLLMSVAAGELPRDTVLELIVSSFPISRAQAEKIMGTLGQGFTPTPAPGTAPAPVATPADRLQASDARLLLTKIMATRPITVAEHARLLQLAQDQPDGLAIVQADDALDDANNVMDPMIEPFVALAERSTSFDDMVASLSKLNLDKTKLQRAIALLTFKARAIGDASDTK